MPDPVTSDQLHQDLSAETRRSLFAGIGNQNSPHYLPTLSIAVRVAQPLKNRRRVVSTIDTIRVVQERAYRIDTGEIPVGGSNGRRGNERRFAALSLALQHVTLLNIQAPTHSGGY